MSLSGVPEGFIEIGEAAGLVGRRIREAINDHKETLKTILDPDEVEKAPPAALFQAGYKTFLSAIGQNTLQVFTLHPASGQLLKVPAFVFTSAKAPKMLFHRPALHTHAGVAADFEQFVGRSLFVERREAVAIAERSADSLLLKAGIQWARVEGLTRSPREIWERSADELPFWPVAFALKFLGKGQDLRASISAYADLLETSDHARLVEICFVGNPSPAIIEDWARTGKLAIFGRHVQQYGNPEAIAKIAPVEWMSLKIRIDFPIGARGLYASRDRPVPLPEWWEDLHVDRRQFLKLAPARGGHTSLVGRRPTRQQLARHVAEQLWGSAAWPKGKTQQNALDEINAWLKAEDARLRKESSSNPKLGRLSLNTVKAAFQKPKENF